MVWLQRNIDRYAGAVIVFVLSLFIIKRETTFHQKKFLIIKLWAIGDSILTLSLIRGIKEKFDYDTIDVLTGKNNKAVYEAYNVNNIYPVGIFSLILFSIKNFRKYDLVFDCEPYFNISAIAAFFTGKERAGFAKQFRSRLYTKKVKFRKDQHMVQNYLDMLRIVGVDYNTDKLEPLTTEKTYHTKPDNLLPVGKKVIGISPGVGRSSKNRMWYPERFAELADKIIEKYNYQIILVDEERNRKIAEDITSKMKNPVINAAGKLNLKETFYLISKCNIFISNDTGPMHVAAAQGCKTIGLFGPNTPVLWGPYGKDNISIYKTELEPAIQNDKGIFKEGNRKEYMGVIQVEDVMDAVGSLV